VDSAFLSRKRASLKNLNVRETIELFASFYSEPRRASEVLEELELTENPRPGSASSRAARSSASPWPPRWWQSRILFLDEPTTGLDPQSRRQLWDIIRASRKKAEPFS